MYEKRPKSHSNHFINATHLARPAEMPGVDPCLVNKAQHGLPSMKIIEPGRAG